MTKTFPHHQDDLDFVADMLIKNGPVLAELGVRLQQGADPDWIENEVALAAFDIRAACFVLGKPKEKEERRQKRRQARLELGLTEEQIREMEAKDEEREQN